MIITAVVNKKHCFYPGVDGYGKEAYEHNKKLAGPIELITEDSPSWKAMESAAERVYGQDVKDSWFLGAMSVYLAIRQFLESSDDEMIWIEADMVFNPTVPLPKRYGVCSTLVWGNPLYVPTAFEHEKRIFCELFVTDPVRGYSSIQSSWMRLKRKEAENILTGLHLVGLDLLTEEAWKRIQAVEIEMGHDKLNFICDMILEIAWMANRDWEAESVFELLGVVSCQTNYESKPIIHFDGGNKVKIRDWIDWCAEQEYHN